MKVLFFLRRTGPYHYARFSALAPRVTLTTVETRPASQEYPWEFDPETPYNNIKFPAGEDVENSIPTNELRAVVTKIFDEQLPDVIITTGWADKEYHAAVLEAAARKIPCVAISDSRHEDEPRKFYKELVKRLLLKSYSAALVAGSMSTSYLKELGFSASAIFQPWDVVDNQHFAGAAKNADHSARYFLCISRFVEKKNLFTLIRAFAAYWAAGGTRKLALMGSGELGPSILKLINELDLSTAIMLPGFVQYDNLRPWMGGALCLILPSTSDQWGLVVNEGMAAGLPVLVSERCGCAPDLVAEGVNGYTFDPTDNSDLLRCMTLIEQKTEDEWKSMSTASEQQISLWSVDAFAAGAEKACVYAQQHRSFGTFTVLHRFLSR